MTEMNGVDLNVESYILKPSPKEVKEAVPRSDRARATVLRGRGIIEEILKRKDSRLLIIAGQCSRREIEEGKEVSHELYDLSLRVSDKIVLVERTYFEKPRTGLGWEGLMIDPHLDGSHDVREGLRLCRLVLLFANELGLPCATEYVEAQSPQFNGDLISWAAIGARTAYSPTHRKLASSLSMPAGIKNDPHGDIDVAVNGILKAMQPNILPDAITEDGKPAIVKTKGNPYSHLVLRGGQQLGPNYDERHVREALAKLKKHEDLSGLKGYEHLERYGIKGVLQAVLIDCSHDNVLENGGSTDHPKWRKNPNSYERQAIVFEDGIRQRRDGNKGIVGFMVETNILGGNQPLPSDLRGFDKSILKYGLSVTDGCIPLSTFKSLVLDAYKVL